MSTYNTADDKEKEIKNIRGNSSVAFKSGFWYVLSNFLAKAISFITTPIFARLMSVSDYGEFSNFASWAVLLLVVCGCELYNTLSRAYYDFKNHYDDYISSITILGMAITLIVYLLFLLFGDYFYKMVNIPRQYVHLLFFFILFSFCKMVFYSRERMLYKYKSVAFITFLSLVVPTIISICLVYFLPATSNLSGRLYGFYFPSAIIGFYCAFSLFNKSRVFKWDYCKYALVLSLPLLVHYLNIHLLMSSSVLITKNIVGPESAAVVSLANSVTHIFTILSQSVSGALTPWLMDNLEMKKTETVRKGLLIYVLLLAVLVTAIFLIVPEIVFILGGKKYISSVALTPNLVYAAFIQSISAIFAVILTYDKNVIKTAGFTTVFALINVTLKVYILPGHGLIELTYVDIFVFGAMLVTNFILVKMAGYAVFINIKGMATVVFVTGIVMIASQILYNFPGIRYWLIGLFVLCFMVCLARNKKRVLSFIKRVRTIKGK